VPSNPSAIELGKTATYSHAPAQARFDVSNMTAPAREPGTVPYSMAADNSDPLTGFVRQSDKRLPQTEAERIGADRYGMAWPMIRAQRLHGNDPHVSTAILRRMYAHSRAGEIFVPLEVSINPAYLWHGGK
jgi:hypothetical protein